MPQRTRWRFCEFTDEHYTMRGRRAKWFANVEKLNSKIAINFRTMLNPINADDFFAMINPVENPPVADAEFAETGQIIGHSDEPPMDHHGGIFREPENFAFDTRADGGVEFGQLRVRARTYFDPVGHDR